MCKQWHCIQCGAKLNLQRRPMQPGDLPVFAVFPADAAKVCPPCEDVAVPSVEEQVMRIWHDEILRTLTR